MRSTDISEVERRVAAAFGRMKDTISARPESLGDVELNRAVAEVAFFIAVSLHVMKETKPSRLKAATRLCAVQALLPRSPE